MTGETARETSGPYFDLRFRQQLKDLIAWRRDIRHFKPDPIDPALVDDLIHLACLSPSVGNSQPWRFVLVENQSLRVRVRANFAAANSEALHEYEGERARVYASLKLAGLDKAPVQMAVFCDRDGALGHGLGSRTVPETITHSVAGAVTLLALAARAWGIGVGFVSILDPERLCADLEVPEHWHFVAYLCLGYPAIEDSPVPELERRGWQERLEYKGFIERR